MRAAFALLALGLLGVSAWAAWDDAHPEWRRYQRELVRREAARLETELAAARREADRPEVRAEVARLDRLLARDRGGAAEGDPAAAVPLRIRAAQDEEAGLRAAVRRAERELAGPATGGPRGELLERLKDVQARYAAATGTWPPDRDALTALWTERDSLSAALERLESPARELRERLDAK
ncbi:MAG TPA: hypothetical protein VKU85_17540, partial [bacterium]|nr:hypothetical protein [bacterium]